jgi:hypothetical protein
MSVSRREALIAGTAVSGLLAASARGQTPPAGERPNAPPHLGDDPLLAAVLLIEGRKQTEIFQAAEPRVKDETLRSFIKTEIGRRQKLEAQLKQLGYEYPAEAKPPEGANLPPGVKLPTLLRVGKLVLAPGLSRAAQIEEDVARTSVANFKKHTGGEDASKFQQMFAWGLLISHYAWQDRIQVFVQHATAQLQPTLKQEQAAIDQHIGVLQGLVGKLGKS